MIQQVIPELRKILNQPTSIGKVHQSVYRNTQILNHIMKMVSRGDSSETIWDVYYFLTGTEKSVDSIDEWDAATTVLTSSTQP